jgi:hypothetical protein
MDMNDEIPEYEDGAITSEPQKVETNNSLKSNTSHEVQEVEPETIEISEQGKQKTLPYVEKQTNKFYRFRFKDEANKNKLIKKLQEILGTNITVDIDNKETDTQNKPDILLKENGEIIGKINLLLCDRRDANLPEKYYIKLYFREFKTPESMNKVKEELKAFFENFESATKNSINTLQGGVKITKRTAHKTHKTHKKRKHIKRRKTNKRNKKSLKRA